MDTLKWKEIEAEIDFKDLFNYVQDIANDGFFIQFMDKDYEYLSPRFKEILGYKDNEMENHPDSWKKIIFPEDLERLWEKVTKSFENNVPFIDSVRYKHKNGGTVHVLCRGYVYKRDDEGKPLIIVGTHTDVSELEEAKTIAEEAKNAAEEANKGKTVFVTEINHEISAPLNAIMGYAQLLEMEMDDGDPKKQKEYVKLILKYGQYLKGTIKDLSSISKMELGILEFKTAPHSVYEILDEAIRITSMNYKIKRVYIFPPDPFRVTVIVDRQRLFQVFTNVISNSIKYNRDGGDVTITQMTRNGRIYIKIKDTGVGMTQYQLDSIFTPFVRFSTNPEIEGTGLGLTVTKSIMKRMDGDISFTSVPGEGTECTITLNYI